MSTTDPRVRAAQRASKGFGASGWWLLCAFLVVWILTGVVSALLLQEIRTAVAGDPSRSMNVDRTRGFILLVPVALIVGGCVLGAVLAKPLGYTRIGDTVRRTMPTVLAFAGVAVGLALYWALIADPVRLADQNPTLAEWIILTAPVWLPLLLLFVAACVFFIPKLRERRVTRAKATRTHTRGVVASMEFTSVAQGGGQGSLGDPIVKVVVQFTDASGTQRWVTKRVAYHRSGRPDTGTRLPVYYDSERPGNTRRILVAFPDLYKR